MPIYFKIFLASMTVQAALNFWLLSKLNTKAETLYPYKSKRNFQRFENYFLTSIYFNYDLNDDFYAKNKLMVLAARINFLFFIIK